MSDPLKPGEQARITWSQEHTSQNNPEPHHDVYRRTPDASGAEKIGHEPSDPGVDIPVKQGS